jgi:8-oxo-dGTP pyrophosphatase MutT (NUDIX family)
MASKLISQTYLSEHRYFTARRDAYQMESGKIVDPYFVVELPPSATAMAITNDQQVILLEQYRHPVGETLYELPGGFIEPGEDPISAIERELLEETGFKFDHIERLGETMANPGVLNNTTQLFLATGGIQVQEQQLDANEEIRLLFQSIETTRQWLMESRIKQSMHALCLFYGLNKLGRF